MKDYRIFLCLGLITASSACTHTSPADQKSEVGSAGGEQADVQSPSTMKSFASLEWSEAAPGSPLKVSTLWGSPTSGPYGMYLKMPAGFETGMHFHTHDYHGILIQGTWEHWDAGQSKPTKLAPGSFVMQPGQAHHGDRCMKGSDCIVLLVQQGKNDFFPVKKSNAKVTPKKASKMVDVSKLTWKPAGPSMPLEVSTIWGNPEEGAYGMYLKLPPGFEAGLHSHTSDYHGILISGTWEHWDAGQSTPEKLMPGSYVMQPGAAPHGDRCASDEACIILLVQDHKRDFIPFQDKAAKAETKIEN